MTTFRTRLLASSLLISAAMLATPAYAQEAEDKETQGAEDVQETVPETTPEPVEGEAIVVTGSRIRQDAFNSPTPIQVLDADEAAKVGVSSATELLQRSTVASDFVPYGTRAVSPKYSAVRPGGFCAPIAIAVRTPPAALNLHQMQPVFADSE